MQLHSIIKQEKKLAVPTKLEQQKIESITKEILNKVNNQLKKNNINAKLLSLGYNKPRPCIFTESALNSLSKEKLFMGIKK